MTALGVSWDAELWRWTLSSGRAAPPGGVATWAALDVAVHADAASGELLEVSVDAVDDRGRLEADAAATLDLLLGADAAATLVDGGVVPTDAAGEAELVRRALDTARAAAPPTVPGSGPVGAVHADGPATVDRSWIPAGVLDLSGLRTRLDDATGVLTVTCGIDSGAYVPAVGGISAVVLDEVDDLVIGLAAFRAGTTPDGPGAVAEVIVGRDVGVDRLGLVLTADPSRLPSRTLRRLRAGG